MRNYRKGSPVDCAKSRREYQVLREKVEKVDHLQKKLSNLNLPTEYVGTLEHQKKIP